MPLPRSFATRRRSDDLRQLMAKADARAHAAQDLFERVLWLDGLQVIAIE